MKTFFRYMTVFAVLLSCEAVEGGSPAFAQRPAAIRQAVLDSIANPPIDRDDALKFDFKEVEISIRETDAPRLLVFPFVNAGDRELRITGTSASCGCTTVAFSSDNVSPGETGEIAVSYNPYNQTGKINRHVYVYTDASELHPVARLTIKGEIIVTDEYRGFPATVGELRAKRNTVDFGVLQRSGGTRSERIWVCNTSSRPVTPAAIELMLPAWLSFGCEPETIPPKGEADLVFTIDTEKLPAGLAGQVRLPFIIGGLDGPPSRRTVTVILEISGICNKKTGLKQE